MTPTATRLKARLDERRRWFLNQWFFKWHHIGGDRPVEIDTFDGGSAHYGGIAFCGSARDAYWDTLVRGVRREIDQQLAWVDQEVRNYNQKTALRAIDECAGQLMSFVSSIRRHAVKKDRILRGDGHNFPPENDAGRWDGTSNLEIQSQADALKAALPFPVQEGWWSRNRSWLEPTGWVIGAVGTISGLLAFFV